MSATENDSPAGVASPCCLGPKVRRCLLRRHGTSISTAVTRSLLRDLLEKKPGISH